VFADSVRPFDPAVLASHDVLCFLVPNRQEYGRVAAIDAQAVFGTEFHDRGLAVQLVDPV
jgi:hypothetical protein